MTRVLYTCPFVPAEWIAAHGLAPSRIIPAEGGHGAGVEAAEGLCPFARATLNDLARRPGNDWAFVFTTACDQMRRAPEAFATCCPDRPTFLMNVPTTWQSQAGLTIYADELRRLGQFLVSLGGTPPTDERLAAVILACDDARATLRTARPGLTARAFAEQLAAFNADLDTPATTSSATIKHRPEDGADHAKTTRLALVGGPLLARHFDVFDVVERFGGEIVLDATAGGEMSLPGPLDRDRVKADPFAALVNAYFGKLPHAMRRPDTMLHDYLAREFESRGVAGVLLHRQLWCDLWHGQLPRIREHTALPVLDIDVADEDTDFGRQAGRIQAFMEMLGGNRR